MVALARERAEARAARDWARADALRGEIEAAGWKVVDRGVNFTLDPAAPPTIEADGVVRYGAAAAVPSVLDEPDSAAFSVELIADDWPEDLARTLDTLRAHAPDGTQVVVVANDPAPGQLARLAPESPDLDPIVGSTPEVVWTSRRLGEAAARNVGLRRARGALVVLADTSVELTGDALTPLAAALDDPGVAVAGAFGLVSVDLRRFDQALGPAVDAVELSWLGFRRADLAALGPLDERFAVPRYLDVWWSLVLRDGSDPTSAPRGARRLDLPLSRRAHRGRPGLPEDEQDRLSRRSFYRLLDRFRDRSDLLSGPPPRDAEPGGPGAS